MFLGWLVCSNQGSQLVNVLAKWGFEVVSLRWICYLSKDLEPRDGVPMRRVVVTGLGMVSPVGNDVETAWATTCDGRTAVDKISQFDASGLPVQLAAEVRDLDVNQLLDVKEQRRVTRFVKFAVKAAAEAVEMSGLPLADSNERVGASIGVGLGSIEDIEENTKILENKGPKRISPFFMPYTIANMAAGVVSIRHKLGGPNICPTTACASGTHGIGEAFLYIRSGMADAMVCGGAESTITPLGISAFAALKALSTRNDDPKRASRPFDKDRDGFVMGEGCGLLVLEDLESAQKRGAKIYCEIVGYGLTGDGYHITAPPEGAIGGERCMKMALDMGRVPIDEVDYINAHGTSTRLNDLYESQAISHLFGQHKTSLSVSSTKGVTGHCIGAAGGIEAVLTVMSIVSDVVPPTANCDSPDTDCGLDYTTQGANQRKIRYALSNSFGFGGTNATLAFRRFDS